MKLIKHAGLWVGALVMVISGTAFAENNSGDVQAELDALKTRIAELENTRQQTWLNERRAEEVKNLIREVLADAETRASLLENGMYAGHDGTTFFLKSADGGFLMNIDGQIQVRFIFNSRDDSGDDDGEAGFEVRRAKIQFSGHIADPRIKYALRLAVNPRDNEVFADRIVIGYQLTDTLFIWAGEDKAPFLREELTSSRSQLAIERSYANEIFTLDKVQGIGLKWNAHDRVKVQAMISDGMRSADQSGDFPFAANLFTQAELDGVGPQDEDRDTSKLFNEDAADFAITARVDVLLAGQWSQMKDFSSWSGEELAVFVGAALHIEEGETGDAFFNNDFISWTVDASVEYNGWNGFIAIMGMTTDLDGNAPAGFREYDLFGIVLQGGYNIPIGENSVEPFIRWEFIDFDNAVTASGINNEDEVNLITFGANFYLDGHNAKASLDVVVATDPIPFGSPATHLLPDALGEDGQVVLRTQFQLLF